MLSQSKTTHWKKDFSVESDKANLPGSCKVQVVVQNVQQHKAWSPFHLKQEITRK